MDSVRTVALALPALLACCQPGDVNPTEQAAPEELVASSPFVTLLTPVLDPEVAVDRRVIGGTGLESRDAVVARSGSQFVAVWTQRTHDGDAPWSIRFTRIAADGTVLDPAGRELCLDCVGRVAVAPLAGGRFLFAFTSIDAGVGVGTIEPDGTVSGIGTVADASSVRDPDVATDGSEALIVYRAAVGQTRSIRAARYDGSTLHPPVVIGTATFDSVPRVAAQPGGGYLAVWHNDSDNVRGRFISPEGVSGDALGIANSGAAEMRPDVAAAGSTFVVVWNQETAIRARTVSPAGELGATVRVSLPAAAADDPSITCSNSPTCLIVWRGGPDTETSDVRGRQLNPDLTPASDEVVLAGGESDQGPAAVDGGGGEYYLAWRDDRSGIPEILGASAADDGDGLSVGAERLLATGRHQELQPAVAASGDGWLVAWSDSRNGGSDIFGKQFGLDGIPETLHGQPVHQEPGFQELPGLGWNGSRFLAAWADYRAPYGIRAARIEPDGSVLDPGGITLGTGDPWGSPAVAGGPAGRWLVAWRIENVPGPGMPLSLAVVRSDGTATAPVDVAPSAEAIAVAFDTRSHVYLIAWVDWTVSELRARRVGPDGAFLDPAPVVLATGVSSSYLKIAEGTGSLLLAWGAGPFIVGSRLRLGPSGIELLDPEPRPLVSPSGSRKVFGLGFVARGFLLVYETQAATGFDYDIAGIRISNEGVADGPPFMVASGPDQQLAPVVAATSEGRALVAYTRRRDDEESRVFVRRLVAAYPKGATCTAGSQCDSGFCADGRCCDQACGGSAEDCQACSQAAGASADGVCTVLDAGTFCRRRADLFCDRAERCDGVSELCPVDVGVNEGAVCDADCGAVCPLADESGSPHVCPACP